MADACFHAANMVCAGGNSVGIAQSEGCFCVAAVITLPDERPGRLMDCSLAESLPKRSGVVTRRSEPALVWFQADFHEVSASDAAHRRGICGPGE